MAITQSVLVIYPTDATHCHYPVSWEWIVYHIQLAQEKDPNSKLKVRFLRMSVAFALSLTSKNFKSNRPKSETICNSSIPLPAIHPYVQKLRDVPHCFFHEVQSLVGLRSSPPMGAISSPLNLKICIFPEFLSNALCPSPSSESTDWGKPCSIPLFVLSESSQRTAPGGTLTQSPAFNTENLENRKTPRKKIANSMHTCCAHTRHCFLTYRFT